MGYTKIISFCLKINCLSKFKVHTLSLTNSLSLLLRLRSYFSLTSLSFSFMDNTQKFKDKQAIQMLPQLSLGPSISHDRLAPIEEVKLAATAISLNIRLRSSDMPVHMQERALRYTRSLLDQSAPKSLSKFNPTHLARALKKVQNSIRSHYLCEIFLYIEKYTSKFINIHIVYMNVIVIV